MPYIEALFPWLTHSALVSLVVLVVGTAAVLLCRQPTRRARIIELILIGCLVAPWLGVIPGYPQLALARWNTGENVRRDVATPPPVEPTLVQATARIVPPGDSIRLPDARGVSPSAASTAEMPAREPAATNVPVRRGADFDLLGVEAGSDTSERSDFRFTDIDFASWIVALYLLGVAIGAAWLLVGLAGLARIMLTGRPAPPHCRELLGEIAGRGGARVRLIVSRWVHQPFAAAWGRPVIVLPENLCGDRQSLRWCLAHEWTHVERRDFRVWLLAGVVRVVFFYHPLVWWLRRQLRLCQDFVADAHAAGHAPQPEDYAEFLTVRAAAGSLHPAVVGLGMGFRKSELYRRIVMLVQNRPIESRAAAVERVGGCDCFGFGGHGGRAGECAERGRPGAKRRPDCQRRGEAFVCCEKVLGGQNVVHGQASQRHPGGVARCFRESVEGSPLVAAGRLTADRATL